MMMMNSVFEPLQVCVYESDRVYVCMNVCVRCVYDLTDVWYELYLKKQQHTTQEIKEKNQE